MADARSAAFSNAEKSHKVPPLTEFALRSVPP
jgi:hypothetical protein